MDITVYILAYNEEIIMQYTIDFYRKRFPNCTIVIYDNQSTDNTKQIALSNNCQIVYFDTNNQINEYKITNMKNNCWKQAKTDWVCVCDADECLDITSSQLDYENSLGNTIIKSQGWNMVNMFDNYDIANIKHGTRVPQYDKNYLFNKSKINQMNFSHGCHSASPNGTIKYSSNIYKLYHYKCIHPDHLIERFKISAIRLSEENKKAGMGTYWLNQTEDGIRAGFNAGREAAKANKVID